MNVKRVPCRECGAEILPSTAEATGGLCKQGTRQQIEAGKEAAKRWKAEQKKYRPFDDYWSQLVDRVYHRHEVLSGNEALFYRWSCIYGETMVDGVEAYLERRFDQFDADMESLCLAGFADVAADFTEARNLIFGEGPLDESTVAARIAELLSDSDQVQPILAGIDQIYTRLIPRLESLCEFKYAFGLREQLYSEGLH